MSLSKSAPHPFPQRNLLDFEPKVFMLILKHLTISEILTLSEVNSKSYELIQKAFKDPDLSTERVISLVLREKIAEIELKFSFPSDVYIFQLVDAKQHDYKPNGALFKRRRTLTAEICYESGNVHGTVTETKYALAILQQRLYKFQTLFSATVDTVILETGHFKVRAAKNLICKHLHVTRTKNNEVDTLPENMFATETLFAKTRFHLANMEIYIHRDALTVATWCEANMSAQDLRRLTRTGYSTNITTSNLTVFDLNEIIRNVIKSDQAGTITIEIRDFQWEHMDMLFVNEIHKSAVNFHTFDKFLEMEKMLILSQDGVDIRCASGNRAVVFFSPNMPGRSKKSKKPKTIHRLTIFVEKYENPLYNQLEEIQLLQAIDYQELVLVCDDIYAIRNIQRNICRWLVAENVHGRSNRQLMEEKEEVRVDRLLQAYDVEELKLMMRKKRLEARVEHASFLHAVHYGAENRRQFGYFFM